MTAGLKTIIALSFVRPSPVHHLSPTTLTQLSGPRHRFPPRHPLFSLMAQLSAAARRRNLRLRPSSQLDLQPLRQPG